jgi:hypothetical protein
MSSKNTNSSFYWLIKKKNKHNNSHCISFSNY